MIFNLSAPWVTYYHDVNAMFKNDPDVKVALDEKECKLYVRVDGEKKAAAISKLLPEKMEFGDVTLNIYVTPSNLQASEDVAAVFKDAFKGNGALSFVQSNHDETFGPVFSATYIVFKNEVVQYFNDDLSDVHGNRSTLYQDIAKRIFVPQNGMVYYCTDTPLSSLTAALSALSIKSK